MIQVHIEPRVVKSWDEFRQEKPPFSMALDGYVKGKTNFDSHGPYANFNHHEDVDRLSTRSSCGQVYVAIKQGLFDTFQDHGEFTANIFIDDCDQDTSLALWLLENAHRIHRTATDRAVRNLVLLEDLLDTTAGAYPLRGRDLMEIAWVFQPYTDVRKDIATLDAERMRAVIDAVGNRISKHLKGEGGTTEIDARYELLGGGTNWRLVREIGPYARTRLFDEGLGAYVLVETNDRQPGAYWYSIGRMSPYVNFPILAFFALFNAVEGLDPAGSDCWGGSDIIGGSPRQSGSRIRPNELARLINDKLEQEIQEPSGLRRGGLQ